MCSGVNARGLIIDAKGDLRGARETSIPGHLHLQEVAAGRMEITKGSIITALYRFEQEAFRYAFLSIGKSRGARPRYLQEGKLNRSYDALIRPQIPPRHGSEADLRMVPSYMPDWRVTHCTAKVCDLKPNNIPRHNDFVPLRDETS